MTRSAVRSMSSETLKKPKAHKAHRAGPVEIDHVGRRVQTCLRCDVLLAILVDDVDQGGEPHVIGKRIFLSEDCPGFKPE